MVIYRSLFFVTFISLMIAAILLFIPTVDMTDLKADEHDGQTAFMRTAQIVLTKDHLVSFFKGLPLHHRYHNIQLENDHLIITSEVDTHSKMIAEHIYQDACLLIEYIYLNSYNIKKIYINFKSVGHDKSSLLLAVNSDHQNYSPLPENVYSGEMNGEKWLKEHTQLVYGTGWSK